VRRGGERGAEQVWAGGKQHSLPRWEFARAESAGPGTGWVEAVQKGNKIGGK